MHVVMAGSAAVEMDRVSKRFGDIIGLDSLTLTITRGEVFGLLGPNGSGKTTAVNLLSGLSRPTSGSVKVFGREVGGQTSAVRRQLGVVPQETALYEELSADANLRFHGDLFDVPRKLLATRMDELLELVQLADRRRDRVSTFSGGMKRRLALARALLHDPELLYLDEPTLGVDVQSRRALWEYILALKTRGKTALITTNYLEEANALCDRVAIIDRGRLVALDTPDQLKRRHGDTVLDMTVEGVMPADLLARLQALAGVTGVHQQDGVLRVSMAGTADVTGEVVTTVTATTKLLGIAQRLPNLDDVFLELTGSEMRD